MVYIKSRMMYFKGLPFRIGGAQAVPPGMAAVGPTSPGACQAMAHAVYARYAYSTGSLLLGYLNTGVRTLLKMQRKVLIAACVSPSSVTKQNKTFSCKNDDDMKWRSQFSHHCLARCAIITWDSLSLTTFCQCPLAIRYYGRYTRLSTGRYSRIKTSARSHT